MAKIRGLGAILVFIGFIGIFGPFCGFQNKLILSLSQEYNLSTALLSGIFIICGIIIFVFGLYLSFIDNKSKEGLIEEPKKNWQCPNCKRINPNTTYVCKSCGCKLN